MSYFVQCMYSVYGCGAGVALNQFVRWLKKYHPSNPRIQGLTILHDMKHNFAAWRSSISFLEQYAIST